MEIVISQSSFGISHNPARLRRACNPLAGKRSNPCGQSLTSACLRKSRPDLPKAAHGAEIGPASGTIGATTPRRAQRTRWTTLTLTRHRAPRRAMPDDEDLPELPTEIQVGAGIPPALIQSELARITRSRSFQGSRRHQQLLRHLVEQAVAGNTGALKEQVLAIEVFERPPGSLDPTRDTIVRVEARRLRQRLGRYYADEGSGATLEIHLPVGSYVPTLRQREGQTDATTRRARDLVERGEYFLRQPLSKSTLDAALARFDAALRESPEHVGALVGMGRAWLNLATGWHGDPRPAADHAAEALHRALDLDAGHASAHALMGAVLHQFKYDWATARAHFERATILAPQQAFVHSAFGFHLLARSELARAERELLLARRIDPQYVSTRMHMVNLRICQHRFAEATAELEGVRDLAPDNVAATGLAALIAMLTGDPHGAVQLYGRVCELAPAHPNAYACLAAAQGMAGDLAAADATVATALARFGASRMSPYVLGIVATRCGRHDRAFEHLDDAIVCRDPNVMMLTADPSFADLHDDPRWAALLARRRASD
jgi:Flp pilus assembly protein TadD